MQGDDKLNDENRIQVAIIADPDTATGFRLAGVPIVRELDERAASAKLQEILNEVISNESVKFVIITEPIVEAFGVDKFEKIRKTLPPDIVLSVIPDRSGSRSKIGEEHLRQLIRRAIGAKRT
jgi:vacuolar-type H+-ATPase subunit F/Vma7